MSYNLEAQVYTEPQILYDLSNLLEGLSDSTPNYHIEVIALEMARLRSASDRNQTLPTLDLTAQIGFRGSGGSWGGIDLIVNPFTKGKNALIELIIHLFMDVAVRHVESFSMIADVNTAAA